MNNIFTLSILTAVTVAAGILADVSPAMAQGARFQYPPNKWATREGSTPSRYLNQIHNQPMTSVGHGMVPKASSFLGVDPSFLKPVAKPAPPAPLVTTNVHPNASWGQPQAKIVPKAPQPLAATPYNPLFGIQPTKPPVIAQAPALQAAPPQQMAAPASANRSLSGRLVPRHNSSSHAKSAVAGRLMKPAQPHELAAMPKVMQYAPGLYKPGSVKPSASFSSQQSLYGQIIHK